MRNIQRSLLFVTVLALSLGTTSTFAAPAPVAAPVSTTTSSGSGWELIAFRASQISVVQSEGNSFSGILTWNPGYRITHDFAVRLSGGASYMKNRVEAKFVLLEYGALGAYRLNDSFSVEAGAGFQNWLTNGGQRLMAQGNGLYHLGERFMLVDRLVLGYTALFVPTNLTHEIRVGLGVTF